MIQGKVANKLKKLMNTKIKIRTAIVESGVNMPSQIKFNEFDQYIKKIKTIEDTTDTQDLMLICDMLIELKEGTYKESEYTEDEIIELNKILDLIVEGE